MESIGRDNIKTNSYVINEQLKDNNKFRPLYAIGFILVALFITIAYASLAINLGVKVHEPRVIPPDTKGDDVFPEPTPEPEPPAPKPPKPYVPPIVPPVDPPKVLDWRIQFENLSEFAGSMPADEPAAIDSSKTGIHFKVRLLLPGDYYKFKVDLANRGNYDAKIYTIISDELTPDQARYLDFTVKYADGTPIQVGDELLEGSSKPAIVEVKFREDISPEDLPRTDHVIEVSYQIVYVEK